MERFTYLGSDIHVSAGSESEVNRRLGPSGESWIHWIMGCGSEEGWRKGRQCEVRGRE